MELQVRKTSQALSQRVFFIFNQRRLILGAPLLDGVSRPRGARDRLFDGTHRGPPDRLVFYAHLVSGWFGVFFVVRYFVFSGDRYLRCDAFLAKFSSF